MLASVLHLRFLELTGVRRSFSSLEEDHHRLQSSDN
eukprot:SAG11_NODE_40961_length_199_cov_19.150000_1_plen_35_part_10